LAADKLPPVTLITLKLNNVTLKKAVREISTQTGYHFFYNDGSFDMNQRITLNVVRKDLFEVIGILFPESKVTVKGKQIILSVVRKRTDIQRSVSTLVNGTVTNESGAPVFGVSVLQYGTTNGTETDKDGHFELNVPDPGARLKFSSVEFRDQIIPLNNYEDLTVTMRQKDVTLNEVVVVGYGTQKRPVSYTHLTLPTN
jgi:hypothetical protein